MHHHDNRRAAEICDMREVAQAVVAYVGVEGRRNHVGGDAGNHQRVAGGLGRRARRGADDAAGAAAVLDVELLAERGRELLGDQPAERVGGAARRERRNDLHRPVRPGLCLCLRVGAGQAQERRRCKFSTEFGHACHLSYDNILPTLSQLGGAVMPHARNPHPRGGLTAPRPIR